MRKRIVYLVQGLATGGLERVVLHLGRAMVRRGHEVHICCYDKLGDLSGECEAANIKVTLVPRKPGRDLGYVRCLKKWLVSIGADVLHMHNSTAFFYGTLAGRWAHVPCLIYTEHDGSFPRSGKVRWINRRLVKRLTQATAVSQAVKDLWCGSDGIDPADVLVVPNGVPGPGESSRPSDSRQGDETLRIGTVGRLSPEKGMDVLVEGFALVHEQRADAELVLVGDGAERLALEELVSQRGLTDHVRFLGCRDDVADQLTSFDIFVQPSRSEGLPLSVLEAMATSLPIIATSVGGIPEAIRSGENGLLIPSESPQELAAAVMKVAGDTALGERLGARALEDFHAHYDVEAMVAAYEKLM